MYSMYFVEGGRPETQHFTTLLNRCECDEDAGDAWSIKVSTNQETVHTTKTRSKSPFPWVMNPISISISISIWICPLSIIYPNASHRIFETFCNSNLLQYSHFILISIPVISLFYYLLFFSVFQIMSGRHFSKVKILFISLLQRKSWQKHRLSEKPFGEQIQIQYCYCTSSNFFVVTLKWAHSLFIWMPLCVMHASC